MAPRNRSDLVFFFLSLFKSHTAIHVWAQAKKKGLQKVSNRNLGKHPPFLKITLFLSALLPCQIGFCSSISLFSLLPAANKKYANGDGHSKEKCWHLSSPPAPKYTHIALAPFSQRSSWPSFRCLCLFWLSLKHDLTIADVLPAPHPFILPTAEPFWVGLDRCWDKMPAAIVPSNTGLSNFGEEQCN